MNKCIKKIIFIFCLYVFSFGIIFAQNQDGQGVDRYALYVASNLGGEDRATLRYAGSDAEKLSQTMIELGGVKKQNSFVLIDSTKEEIDGAFRNITAIMNNAKENAKRVEFLFYYSGHSDENALLLGEEAYDYSELKAKISDIPSDVHVVVLDSCFSGNFIRAKGGTRQKSFLVDDSSVVKGHAYLSSSSETESSQESDDIEASYFTQALITGLRGAADTSGDNRVSLNELYYYAFNETLKQTETSAIGTQHPSFDITLVGSGDLVLTDISTAESVLVLPPETQGRFLVRTLEGKLAAEINKPHGTVMSLALPAGFYSVTLIGDEVTTQAQVKLAKNEVYTLNSNDHTKIALSQGVGKGEENVASTNRPTFEDDLKIENIAKQDELNKVAGTAPRYLTDEEIEAILNDDFVEFDDDEKEVFDFVRDLFSSSTSSNGNSLKFSDIGTNYLNCNMPKSNLDINIFSSNDGNKDGRIVISSIASINHCVQGIQLSGISSVAKSTVQGVQFSGISNVANKSMFGFQIAGISNVVNGKMQGFQITGISNVANDGMQGFQVSGIVNIAKGKFMGIQSSGLVNVAGDIQGYQTTGLVNVADKIQGVQASNFINIANEIKGVQFGVINIAKSNTGVAFGLINIVKDGIVDPAFYWENDDMFIQFQSGTNAFYTTFLAGTNENFAFDYGILGAGIGTRIGKGFLGLDIELLAKQLVNYSYVNDLSKIKTKDLDDFKNKYAEMVLPYMYPSGRLALNLRFGKNFGIFFSANADLQIVGENDKAFENRNTGNVKLHEFDNMSFKTHTSCSFGFKF